MNYHFKKQWSEDDFKSFDEMVGKFFTGKRVQYSDGGQKKNVTIGSFAHFDEIMGLAYTSSGMHAVMSVCNTNFYYEGGELVHFAFTHEGLLMAEIFDSEYNFIKHVEISDNIQESDACRSVLGRCIVDDKIVRLPVGQLDRALYQEVKAKLELIGGKWKGGKTNGFVFHEDPTDMLVQIASGEKRNLKQEFQFFATPSELASELVRMANLKNTDRVLEPSAGQGAIINAINKVHPEMYVECFEMMPVNQMFLKKIETAIIIGDDFLSADEENGFDKIIANPPFSKNQDIDHIRFMYKNLNPGGRLVSIASKHWQLSSNKKETEFRNWLSETNAEIQEIPAGAFKESGTSISTVIIVIDKAA